RPPPGNAPEHGVTGPCSSRQVPRSSHNSSKKRKIKREIRIGKRIRSKIKRRSRIDPDLVPSLALNLLPNLHPNLNLHPCCLTAPCPGTGAPLGPFASAAGLPPQAALSVVSVIDGRMQPFRPLSTGLAWAPPRLSR